MAVKRFKPATPGTRFRVGADYSDVTTNVPEKTLVVKISKTGGRNNSGKMTMRYLGGGHKKSYRLIDFKRDKKDIPATVATIEYDPNRTSRIALLHYADGEKRYIIAPDGLKVGDQVMSGPGSEINIGNALPLSEMPLGSFVHNVELKPGKGGQLGRSAGASLQLMAREGSYAQLKMPSGEVRMVRVECLATYGVVGNAEQENISLGKAGRKRWLGRRPYVRGVAMNPVDHPMGGGEGKTSGGGHPVSPWGQKAKGLKTRKHKKESNKFIIKRRKNK